jgi:UDP-MurNAc hydroxylase
VRATAIGHAGILVETRHGTVVCDPWFLPAFHGSWFVFPRNDRLDPDLLARIEDADYLYVSHLHADHFDEPFLREHFRRDIPILLPGFPSSELEERFRALGFTEFVPTKHGEPVGLGGLTVTIYVETSITDGPGGDSAIAISDGEQRLLNMNDCRIHDLAELTADGPVDQQWLQFSGAIWYPMVYEVPEAEMRRLVDAKVDAQFSRAIRYVQSVAARAVIPAAGPPCFLDPDLFGFNIVTGDEPSIFPDATEFVRRLEAVGVHTARILPTGSTCVTTPTAVAVEHPVPEAEAMRPYTHKAEYLAEYQADWLPWLDEMKAGWPAPTPGVFDEIKRWWEPLLARAPALRRSVGANALIRAGDLELLVDFPHGEVRRFAGEPYRFRFDIPRPLLELVVAERAVDWSNSLLLSCRFRAWREGEFNEYLYNFLKSLSPERIARAEDEARAKLAPPPDVEDIELGGYVMERWCPHRRADLSVFGRVDGGVLTCELHGWQFDCATGRCLTADDRSLRVRPA